MKKIKRNAIFFDALASLGLHSDESGRCCPLQLTCVFRIYFLVCIIQSGKRAEWDGVLRLLDLILLYLTLQTSKMSIIIFFWIFNLYLLKRNYCSYTISIERKRERIMTKLILKKDCKELTIMEMWEGILEDVWS